MKRLLPLTIALAATSCAQVKQDVNSAQVQDAVSSPIPTDRLQALKAALPKVAYPTLANVFGSAQTFWYDHASMTPSYQASITQSPPYGAETNEKWFNLIADSVQPTGQHFYDTSINRWRFPFGTTAGTDNAQNHKVFNFLALPAGADGKVLPVAIQPKESAIPGAGFTSNNWGWVYPNGTIIGEMIFVTTGAGGAGGSDLLPSEIRIRTRYPNGWSVNIFRPFPTAAALSAAVKARRPAYKSDAKLSALVAALDNNDTLTAKALHATNLPNTFDQDGALDILPDFGDAALVKELLTQTTFISAYGTAWKTASNGAKAFAASTDAALSIVPTHYEGGVIEVSEASCMRCHKDAGRHLTTFDSISHDIVLYGDMWGRDGIFSFHPFDETQYPMFWNSGTTDNRRMNPALVSQGLIASFKAGVHTAPAYPTEESGLGVTPSNLPQPQQQTVLPGGQTQQQQQPPTTTTPPANAKMVEVRIAAGTGSGDWIKNGGAVHAKPGQTIRIWNDDSQGHVLHTNEEPCPHGDVSAPFQKGEYYDCEIPADLPSGTKYNWWDHYLGSPSRGGFRIVID